MQNQLLNNSSIDYSGSEFHFNQSSYQSGDASDSFVEAGIDASILQRKQFESSQIDESIILDVEFLEKYPLFSKQTMRIFYSRTDDPLLKQLWEKQRKLDNQQIQEQEASERAKLTKEFRQNASKLDQITEYNQNTLRKAEQLKEENERIVSGLNNLRQFIKEMTSSTQKNPFAQIDDKKANQSILRLFPSENSKQQSQNKKVQKRPISIQEYQSLDKELQGLTEFESQRLDQIQKQITEFKLKRNQNIQEIQNGQANTKINIISDQIEKIVEKIFESQKTQQIGRPLEEYLNEIEQLQKKKTSIEAELSFQESILSEKANKNELLQKQQKEMQTELRKLKYLSQAQTEDETQGNAVNYQQLILKTYELKENRKRTEKIENHVLENGSEYPKRAKRIVVEQQTLKLTQKVFPSIKNYKQLINWLLVLWIILLGLFFVQKTLVKNDLWFGQLNEPELKLELELKQKPIFENMQTKQRLDRENLMNNISQRLNQEEVTSLNSPHQSQLFELKRKHMEDVNAGEKQQEDDWRSKLASEFE